VDLYGFLKTLHVLSAAIWVGTAIQQQIQYARLRATKDERKMIDFIDEAEFFGKRVFAPISAVTAVFGILLVIQGYPNFNDLWILIAIVMWIGSVAVGAGYLSPQTVKIKELTEQKGYQDPEVQGRIKRVTTATHIDGVLLALVVADMVMKPTL
jgi:uncharacterized membrane protein